MAKKQEELTQAEIMLHQLEEEAKSPLPTAEVGMSVIWYMKGAVEPDNKRPAIVSRCDSPGMVTLTVLPPMGMQVHKKSVPHVSHPLAAKPAGIKVSNGLWDYCDKDKRRVPQDHYKMHLEDIERRKEQLLEQQRLLKQAAEQRDKIAQHSQVNSG